MKTMLDLDRQTHSVEVREADSCVHHKSLVCHHHTQNLNANAIDCMCAVDLPVPVFSTKVHASSLAGRKTEMHEHVAIITETESTYVMIESTLRFDDVEDIPGLLPLLRAVQRSHMRSRKRSGRRPGNDARLSTCIQHIALPFQTSSNCVLQR